MYEQGTLPAPQTSVYLSLAAYSHPAPVPMDTLANMIHHLEVCTCRDIEVAWPSRNNVVAGVSSRWAGTGETLCLDGH